MQLGGGVKAVSSVAMGAGSGTVAAVDGIAFGCCTSAKTS